MAFMELKLRNNGAADPDIWRPYLGTLVDPPRAPRVGDLVGWRYGVWQVIESTPIPDEDLDEADAEKLRRYVSGCDERHRARIHEMNQARTVVLCYGSGPQLAGKAGVRTAENGDITVRFNTPVCLGYVWPILHAPWMTCSCHGQVWPCQEMDQAEAGRVEAEKLDRLMATTTPGVCASCLEPISNRQKPVTFPEESRLVPGAPGPTFHAGRQACWHAAVMYDEARLRDDPQATRVATCPGVRFIHEKHGMTPELRVDCTAGPACTDLHGPAGYEREIACWRRVGGVFPDDPDRFPVPTFDCGYRNQLQGDCLGSLTPQQREDEYEQARREATS